MEMPTNKAIKFFSFLHILLLRWLPTEFVLSNLNKAKTFLFNHYRWFFAESIHYSLLVIGSLTSGTGSFKAIPTLFGILGLPSVLITPFCWLTATTAFVCFYVNYDESMTKAAYNFIDWCNDFIRQAILLEDPPAEKTVNTTPSGELIVQIKNKKDELKGLLTNNQALYRKLFDNPDVPLDLKETRAKLIKYKPVLEDNNYTQYVATLTGIKPVLFPPSEPKAPGSYRTFPRLNFLLLGHIIYQAISSPHETITKLSTLISSFTRNLLDKIKLRDLYKLGIQIFSWGLVFLGCAVVIGMGIITNQAFVSYMGFSTATNLAMLVVILAATSKQICQASLTLLDQYHFYCSLFRIRDSKTKLNEIKLNDLTKQIDEQQSITKKLTEIEQAINISPRVVEHKRRSRAALLFLATHNPQISGVTSALEAAPAAAIINPIINNSFPSQRQHQRRH